MPVLYGVFLYMGITSLSGVQASLHGLLIQLSSGLFHSVISKSLNSIPGSKFISLIVTTHKKILFLLTVIILYYSKIYIQYLTRM